MVEQIVRRFGEILSMSRALMHKQPAHPRTIGLLADAVSLSRSILADRFR